MKNYFLILLLFTGMVKAQIVTIPDVNFKAVLLNSTTFDGIAFDINSQRIRVDTNSDGEIQETEALLVYKILIPVPLTPEPNPISSIEGINSFTNLRALDFPYCQVSSINITLPNLVSLNCMNNLLTALDLSGCPNLENINCSINSLTTLDLATNTNLKRIECDNNQLTSLNISGLTDLEVLFCNSNQLTSLNLNGLTNLKSLSCSGNQFTTLDVNGLINLEGLIFRGSNLTAIDLTGLTNLKQLLCDGNQLTTLNLNGLTNLETLWCYDNQLTSVDFSQVPNLKVLQLFDNQIATLDITNLTNLTELGCGGNLFTSLDLNNQRKLKAFNCSNSLLTTIDLSQMGIDNSTGIANNYYLTSNSNLTYINLKNNRAIESFKTGLSNNIDFICADENNISTIQSDLILDNNFNVQVNSYCSFVPGGHYNTIAGTTTFDADANGCDTNDVKLTNIRININDGTNQGAAFTNTTGNYTFFTQTGSFEITPAVENPTWFNFSPTNVTIPFADNNNNTATQDFCIAANGSHQDLEVVLSPVTPARPGFEAVYKIVYRNKGNTTLNAESAGLILYYDINKMDYVASSQPVTSQGSNSINFGYTTFAPFESRSLLVTMRMHSPTDANPVNIGDVLNFTAGISPNNLDENMDDNSFVYHQTVVGSFDPNSIECLEGAVVPPTEIGNYLHYAINFENTGTFPAENIVVKTEVDASKFNINSLQLMNANFPVDARITGNKVEFIFENINLDIGGHGHILLKIKTNNALVTGDAVANRGDIFFDYNAPIDTGMANTVFQTLSNTGFDVDSSVSMAPNPASNEVTINSDNTIKSIELYDAQGRIVMTSLVNGLESKLNISSYSKGTYFVKITTEKGIAVQKLLKK